MLSPASIAALIVLPLAGWRIYRRLRGLHRPQRLSRGRALVTLTVFPVLLALLAWASRGNPACLPWLAAGLAAGALLAIYGLRLTRFEATADGNFYTPSARLGLALALVLIGRVLYRLVEFQDLDATNLPGATSQLLSPLTLGIVGLLAGYYTSYAAGLVRWRAPAVE